MLQGGSIHGVLDHARKPSLQAGGSALATSPGILAWCMPRASPSLPSGSRSPAMPVDPTRVYHRPSYAPTHPTTATPIPSGPLHAHTSLLQSHPLRPQPRPKCQPRQQLQPGNPPLYFGPKFTAAGKGNHRRRGHRKREALAKTTNTEKQPSQQVCF